MDTSATVSIATRFLAWLVPWLVVRFFPIEKLDALLEIHPISTGEAVDLNYPSRRATCWINVINLTPFRIQLDRLEVSIVADGLSVLIQKVLPDDIPSLSRASVFTQGTFDADPNAIATAVKSTKVRVEVRGYVKCDARSFTFYRHFDNLKGFRING